ncbi:Cyclic di-GMP phosphodiesterase Gmr [Cedecea neteri]|uniref:Cyclic di-GMP phosphodiesterase Gmr n=1 Tax=Cedecea neteri TaxID=158822 RepID=A0A2X3JEM0_9ENTR|nr:Cyclic di-GMP phosphodiesterase Gmr [Cedecea neteri]
MVIDAIYDEHQTLLGFAKITRDISEQKVVIDKISWLARYDALTGLPNRVEFFSFVEKLFTESDYNHIAICTVDLDKFKEINDTEGHLVGDQLLQRVSSSVLKAMEKDEIVARFGGDEFVAAKPYNHDDELRNFTERLHSCFVGKQIFAHSEITVSASIGVAVYPDDATDINTLISNSDLAMYRAKANLDNKICWYEKDMDEKNAPAEPDGRGYSPWYQRRAVLHSLSGKTLAERQGDYRL